MITARPFNGVESRRSGGVRTMTMPTTAQSLQKKHAARRRLPWRDYDEQRVRRLAAFWGEPYVAIVHLRKRTASSRTTAMSPATTASRQAS